MKVVILAGGAGTRLIEKTRLNPKPMVQVGDKPILWHIMKIYSHKGYNEFIVLLGYKGNMIKEYFKKNAEPFWNITFVDTGIKSSKAQRIMKIKDYIKEENFFVAYGDDLADVNPHEILRFHKKHKKTVTLTTVPLESNFGVLEINNSDEVKQFREKPRIDGYWINGGFFCFSKRIFDHLNIDEELEDQTFKKLSKIREIVAFKHEGFWKCMNTYKETIVLNELWENNEAPWKVW
jgi:glucose-1-phosphate cytidylyltransferase